MSTNAAIVLESLDLAIISDVLDHLNDQMPDSDGPDEKFWLLGLGVGKETMRVLPDSLAFMRGHENAHVAR